jgi:hypothetical protein
VAGPAGRQQLLLILDDAAGSDQVRPLLPGVGGSLVLVTSRRHLTALEDATAISLDTLPPGEAATLLVRLAARPGPRPDVDMCPYSWTWRPLQDSRDHGAQQAV